MGTERLRTGIARAVVSAGLTVAMTFGGLGAPVALAAPSTDLTFKVHTGADSTAIKGYLVFKAAVDDDTNQASEVDWGSTSMQSTVLEFLTKSKADTGAAVTYGKWLHQQKIASRDLTSIPTSSMSSADKTAYENAENALTYIISQISSSASASYTQKHTANPIAVPATAATTFSNKLAAFIDAAGLTPEDTQTATYSSSSGSTPATYNNLTEGFWLFYNDAYAPIWTPVGGTEEEAEIKDVNVLTIDKQIWEEESESWGKIADRGSGDKVTYRYLATVPTTTPASVYEFKFTDQLPVGLTFDPLASTITNTGDNVSSWKVYAVPDYTALPTNSNGFLVAYSSTVATDITSYFTASYSGNVLTIAVNKTLYPNGLKDVTDITYSSSNANARILVEYTAVANVSAKTGVTDGADSNGVEIYGLNQNTAKLTYGPEDDPTETTESTSAFASWEIDIVKVDANDKKVRLGGAQFLIKSDQTVTDSAAGNDVPLYVRRTDSALKPLPAETDPDYDDFIFTTDDEEEITTVIPSTDPDEEDDEESVDNPRFGMILTRPLDSGTYTITEIKAPAGYRIPALADTTLVINATKDQSTGTIKTLTAKADNGATVTTDRGKGIVTITLKNPEQNNLPITGMTPNQLATLMGVLLVAVGAITLVTRRRNEAQQA